MKSWFKKGQKGFTLVELMVVMGILGVLAAIVVPAVSGTTEVSTDAQVKTDAGMVQSAIGEYYGDQVGAEVFTSSTVSILSSAANNEQKKSNRWSENYLQAVYSAEFPASNTTVSGLVINNNAITIEQLAEGYNAIDFSKLYSTTSGAAYIPQVPASVTETHNGTSGGYHNYLWLVKKTDAASGSGGTVESRTVVVFKLAKIVTAEGTGGKDTLTYEQIY